MKNLNILFICKWNRFRSQIAEEYFKKINKNKNIKVKSAGLIRGRPQDKLPIKVAKKLGLDISKRPRGLSANLLKWSDLTIIVADDVPLIIFKTSRYYIKKFITWKIKDVKTFKERELERVIKEIIEKADALNEDIKEGKIK